MFLKTLRSARRTLALRLTLWYTVLFTILLTVFLSLSYKITEGEIRSI